MFLIILNFIRSHWLAVAEAILLLTIFIQHEEISYLGAMLRQCKAENVVLNGLNQQLSHAVDSQNAAVVKLQLESDRKSAQAAKSLAAAGNNAKKYVLKAEHLENWKQSGNECADMKKMLDEYVRHGG